jgi:hypothetical protein
MYQDPVEIANGTGGTLFDNAEFLTMGDPVPGYSTSSTGPLEYDVNEPTQKFNRIEFEFFPLYTTVTLTVWAVPAEGGAEIVAISEPFPTWSDSGDPVFTPVIRTIGTAEITGEADLLISRVRFSGVGSSQFFIQNVKFSLIGCVCP